MRTRIGIALLCGTLWATGCTATSPAPTTPAPPAVLPETPTPTPEMTPTPTAEVPTPDATGAPGAQTDPQRLDAVPIRPEELPGWQSSPAASDFADVQTEPADCQELYYLAPGKVANPMGSSVAYTQGDALELRQVADLVDSGASAVQRAEQLLDHCSKFAVVEDANKVPVTVAPLESAPLGERSKAVRFTLGTNPATEVVVVWVAHKDVLLTTAVAGTRVDQQIATDAAATAYQRLREL